VKRVKVIGDLYHGRIPEGAVYVGRQAPGLPANPWHNPHSVRVHDREKALELYRAYLDERPEIVELAHAELAGKDLACWCPLTDDAGRSVPCHADILLNRILGATDV
jgi:hypothetical protein